MDGTLIVLLLVFALPFAVLVASDLLVNRVLLGLSHCHLTSAVIENFLSIAAFYALLDLVAAPGSGSPLIVMALASPRLVMLIAVALMRKQFRELGVCRAISGLLAKYFVFSAIFIALIWMASMD